MNWIAVVPLRQGREPKSRLSALLSREQRVVLSADMAGTVTDALRTCPAIGRILLLSPEKPPEGLPGEWRHDQSRGLNAELNALRRDLGEPAMLVIHGDLPLVGPEDISAIIAAGEQGGHAFAPDRHGAGTNAVAVAPGRTFHFAFGEGSLALHLERTPGAALVRRPGLSLDVDTPEDLTVALAAGYKPPER